MVRHVAAVRIPSRNMELGNENGTILGGAEQEAFNYNMSVHVGSKYIYLTLINSFVFSTVFVNISTIYKSL
jgi:hypothetical protein